MTAAIAALRAEPTAVAAPLPVLLNAPLEPLFCVVIVLIVRLPFFGDVTEIDVDAAVSVASLPGSAAIH